MRHGIALGSNLGDRRRQLQRAVRLMLERIPGAQLLAAAPVYETAPVDCPPDSGEFLNTVIEIECDLAPHALLAMLRQLEQDLGRPGDHGHHAPRTIDLDLLYADGLVIHDTVLTLPHPRLAQRAFVLRPLADIRPERVLPGQSQTVAELWAALRSVEPEPRCVAENWL